MTLQKSSTSRNMEFVSDLIFLLDCTNCILFLQSLELTKVIVEIEIGRPNFNKYNLNF